jgi:ABC-type dipeptide/oligopeptide/nickel transport system, ATPase component
MLLELESLCTYFHTDDGIAKAVDDVSYSVDKNETLGLVGESGCGKSVTALSIMRLVPSPPGFIAGGKIYFKGQNLLELSESEMRALRGNRISMIFQEPMTSLNPVFTCGEQIAEAVRLHQKLSAKDARDKAVEMLEFL